MQDNKNQFTKLSQLIDKEFTIESVGGYKFKRWDGDNRKMLTLDHWEEGYRKIYPIETDKGKLDLGTGQIGNLLEAVMWHGESHLIGKTFKVKSNGKTGMEIRYFFNPVREEKPEPKPVEKQEEDVVDMSDIGDEPMDTSGIPF